MNEFNLFLIWWLVTAVAAHAVQCNLCLENDLIKNSTINKPTTGMDSLNSFLNVPGPGSW